MGAAPSEHTSGDLVLQRSAVLIVVSDGADGPQVLLSQRATDLSDYPGQWVFPGGAAADGDAGPVGTALREAWEEVGLDPSSLEVLGALPSHTLLDSRFLVTPVLAWSPDPAPALHLNTSETTAARQVSLRSLDDSTGPSALGVLTSQILRDLASRCPEASSTSLVRCGDEPRRRGAAAGASA